MRVVCVVGTRPNFVKMASLYNEMRSRQWIEPILVHTGQHYDDNMSKAFFDDLSLPKPDINLDVGSGTHACQTAQIMMSFEPVLMDISPELVIVVGDVNSTLAASLVTAKSGPALAHVEAGLRSGDRSMAEEINRVVVDQLADMLFVTEQSGLDNLRREGISEDKIFFVGNVMIDTLMQYMKRAEQCSVLQRFGLSKHQYALVTLHRPSNTDSKEVLESILWALKQISHDIKVVLPVHPRTMKCMEVFDLMPLIENEPEFLLTEPLGYIDFLGAMMNARVVLTDSGGIQEETTILGVPCLTMRNNTERPITIQCGTNALVGTKGQDILRGYRRFVESPARSYQRPPLWDGHAAKRMIDVLENRYQ